MESKKVKRVLWAILVANLAVAAIKIFTGLAINSTGLKADGFHSLTDGTSNVIGLIGIGLASRPVDEDHPYGHNKYEMLAGMFISALLLCIGGNIIINSIERFVHPVAPAVSLESIFLLVGTLAVNGVVSVYEYLKGKQLGSSILVSDSLHTRSDVFISIGVLVALVSMKTKLPPVIDPIVSLVVSVLIILTAVEILKVNASALVDRAAVDTELVKRIAEGYFQIVDVHEIRSRGNSQEVLIDMHILTAPGLSVEETHELNHLIEEELREGLHANVQLITHFEPFIAKML